MKFPDVGGEPSFMATATKAPTTCEASDSEQWARVELNHRPHAYQAADGGTGLRHRDAKPLTVRAIFRDTFPSHRSISAPIRHQIRHPIPSAPHATPLPHAHLHATHAQRRPHEIPRRPPQPPAVDLLAFPITHLLHGVGTHTVVLRRRGAEAEPRGRARARARAQR